MALNKLDFFFLDISAISSFTSVSVTFISELGFSGTETGLIFLIVLLSTLPGSLFANWLMKKVNPVRCIQLASTAFIIANFAAFFMLGDQRFKSTTWGWSIIWGFLIGGYYPIESFMFSSLMPSGQESELAGFYLYCGQVLGWLPPMVFTYLNENPNINISWGGVHLNIYIAISLVFYFLLPPWEKCLEIVGGENKIIEFSSRVSEDDEFGISPPHE